MNVETHPYLPVPVLRNVKNRPLPHLSSDEYFLLAHGVLDDHGLLVPVGLLTGLAALFFNQTSS